jgi:uncharacterized OB-fold protein
MSGMTQRIPHVAYLELEPEPHLVAAQCTRCAARFFDRRNACASCGGTEFDRHDVATEGELAAFTIVSMAAPGVPVPFVAGVVNCAGTSVRGVVVNTPPDPAHLALGMKLRLTTYSLGTDDQGVEAIAYGFEPAV